jgi:putative transcriptional regulator
MASSVANRVRELRAGRAGMTQQALADSVGVSRQTVNAIETGRYTPSLEVALKIARAFDEPVERVFHLSSDGVSGDAAGR